MLYTPLRSDLKNFEFLYCVKIEIFSSEKILYKKCHGERK